MGVDIYLYAAGLTPNVEDDDLSYDEYRKKKDKACEKLKIPFIKNDKGGKSYQDAQGKYGYLRGSYGGYSDVLEDLFSWDWDKENPKKITSKDVANMKIILDRLKNSGRPKRESTEIEVFVAPILGINFEDHKGEKIEEDYLQELEDFVNLCDKALKLKKKPKIWISY